MSWVVTPISWATFTIASGPRSRQSWANTVLSDCRVACTRFMRPPDDFSAVKTSQ